MNVEYTNNISLFDDLSRLILCGNHDIIVLPNDIYFSQLKDLPQGKPLILKFEGLDISSIVQDSQTRMLTRNASYAIICEIIGNTEILSINQQDIAVFARTMIGELPNIIAHNIKPEDILSRIPVKISMEKEMNIQCFVAIWRAFEIFLQVSKKIPYYKLQEANLDLLIKHIKLTGQKICIVHDAHRSKIYGNFIDEVTNHGITGTVIMHDSVKSQNEITATKVVGGNITEAQQIADTVWYIFNQGKKKIGIVCVDNLLQNMIVKELKQKNFEVTNNLSCTIYANPFLRLFAILFERRQIEEILPILNINKSDKLKILQSIVSGLAVDIPIWQEIIQLFNFNTEIVKKIDEIVNFIKHNIDFLYHINSQTMVELMEFSMAFKMEVIALQDLGINVNDNFFKHFVSSWKVWHENKASDIAIISPEEAYLQKYDAVILTSGAVSKQEGNIIFSEGLRKYYGFAGFDYQQYMVSNIDADIFITQSCKHFMQFQIKEVTIESRIIYSQRQSHIPVAMKQTEVPATISATALEALIVDPQVFYYRYIRYLNTPRYNLQQNLDLGNIVHNVLEGAVKNRNFDRRDINRYFGAYVYRSIFFEERILEIITDIESRLKEGVSIEVETSMQIQITVQNQTFIITARCDRIDTSPDGVIVYDYKSGSSISFTKSSVTKNFEKVQLYIPAIVLQGNMSNIVAKYCFLQNKGEQEVMTEMIPDLLQQFQSFITDLLYKYFIEMKNIDITKGQYVLM